MNRDAISGDERPDRSACVVTPALAPMFAY